MNYGLVTDCCWIFKKTEYIIMKVIKKGNQIKMFNLNKMQLKKELIWNNGMYFCLLMYTGRKNIPVPKN